MATRTREVDRTALPLERTIRQPDPAVSDDADAALESIAAKRTRVVLGLTGGDARRLLRLHPADRIRARTFSPSGIADGLSVGMALGVLVILSTWALTWIYVRWANRVYEPAIGRLRR